MAHTAQFTATVRAVKTALDKQGVYLDVYALLAVADEVCRVHDMPVTEAEISPTEHDKRVALALNSEEIAHLLANDRKILAIKELRYLTGCGLREAKDAIEDPRLEVRKKFS
jgi:ribosomal protein L7/L12